MCASPPTDPTRLLHVAYRAAARVVRNRVLAEEAGERAVHRYLLAVIAGHTPDKPEAWVRTVARRSACAILRNGWARVQPIAEDALFVAEPGVESGPRLADRVRALVGSELTPRQRDALAARRAC